MVLEVVVKGVPIVVVRDYMKKDKWFVLLSPDSILDNKTGKARLFSNEGLAIQAAVEYINNISEKKRLRPVEENLKYGYTGKGEKK